MEDKILTIPAVALRGMTILPGIVAHFDISRDKSLRAVEEAMKGDQKLFIVTQKDTEKEEPQGEDLYEVDRKSTRLNSSHRSLSRMPSSA